jgi:hypothetical protein
MKTYMKLYEKEISELAHQYGIDTVTTAVLQLWPDGSSVRAQDGLKTTGGVTKK